MEKIDEKYSSPQISEAKASTETGFAGSNYADTEKLNDTDYVW